MQKVYSWQYFQEEQLIFNPSFFFILMRVFLHTIEYFHLLAFLFQVIFILIFFFLLLIFFLSLILQFKYEDLLELSLLILFSDQLSFILLSVFFIQAFIFTTTTRVLLIAYYFFIHRFLIISFFRIIIAPLIYQNLHLQFIQSNPNFRYYFIG